MGTWGTLHPRRILHAPDAISVHGGISPGEPGTRAFQSRAEGSFDMPTLELKILRETNNLFFVFRFNFSYSPLCFFLRESNFCF